MRFKLILSALSVGFASIAFVVSGFANAKDMACEHDTATLQKVEREILRASEAIQMAKPLACLLEIHEQADGTLKYFAASYLRTLLGGGQIEGVMKDARYQKVAQALEMITLDSHDPIEHSVVAEFARGDWTFYKLFCEEGDTQFCADFMPDLNSVTKESPLLAAASMVRLKKAYYALEGRHRERIAERIKKLYREVPSSQKIRAKIYRANLSSALRSTRPEPSLKRPFQPRGRGKSSPICPP